MGSKDALVAVTTVCFDIAGLELFLPLVSGARCVLARRDEAGCPMQLAALLHKSQATILQVRRGALSASPGLFATKMFFFIHVNFCSMCLFTSCPVFLHQTFVSFVFFCGPPVCIRLCSRFLPPACLPFFNVFAVLNFFL